MTDAFSITETLQSQGFSRQEGDWAHGEVFMSKSAASGLSAKVWDHHNLQSVMFAPGAMPWVCLTWTDPDTEGAEEVVIANWKTDEPEELGRLLPALGAIVEEMSWQAPNASGGMPGLLLLADDEDFLIQVSTYGKGKPLPKPGFIARWRGHRDAQTGSALGHSYDLAEMWQLLTDTRGRHLAPITPTMAI